jgi:hypothetical protein
MITTGITDAAKIAAKPTIEYQAAIAEIASPVISTR